MTKSFVFQPRARLLLQLGDELIRNESIAVLELVKNSYDADATLVKLSMYNLDEPKKGQIILEDNGEGMDMKTIKDVWMEPGSENKRLIYEKGAKTRIGRTVLGEKGIGRFAVHKLGNSIELVTKKRGKKEVHIKIDWTKFAVKDYLSNIPIEVSEREPKIFQGNSTGTKIIIDKIREPWTRGMLRDVYRSFNALRSPFDSPQRFDVKFETNMENWLEAIPTWKEVKSSALFRFKCRIVDDRISKFRYDFIPWPTMKKLKPRTVTEKDDFKKLLKMKTKDNHPVNLSNYNIGSIEFEGLIYDRDASVLKLSSFEKKSQKEYLDQNGGVRVFRDGVRIYDYGEPGSDWLNLDVRRVNVPSVRISNNIILGAVSLSRAESNGLIEKTNREGFIENESYEALWKAILITLDRVEKLRRTDKNLIRTYYGPTPKSEPVIYKIQEVKITIKKKVKDPALKEELTDQMERIETDYKKIHEILLRSANAGLGLGVAIHEVEKIVDELMHAVKKEKHHTRLSDLITNLSKLLEGYTLTLRKSTMQLWSSKQIIEQSLFNLQFRFKAHEIELVMVNNKSRKDTPIRCSRGHIVGTITNILDNSIWWLGYGDIKRKKIFISTTVDSSKNPIIIIADNGPGFALPTDQIIEPFVSGKPDGMGLGLHIANEIMMAHKGKLDFPEWGEYEIPRDFKGGSIVTLTFPKENK